MIALRALFLAACAAPALSAAAEITNEGFYPPDAPPAGRLEQFMIDGHTLSNVRGAVGVYLTGGFAALDARQAEEYKENVCGSPEARPWRRHLCEIIDQGHCKDGCYLPRFSGCTGTIVEGGYFVTAMHCSDSRIKQRDAPGPAALLMNAEGKTELVRLLPTAATRHREPYELSIYKLERTDGFHPGVKIRQEPPRLEEAVFGIGFPWLGKRKNRAADYAETNGEPRVTFGRVVLHNPLGLAYCGFSNDVGKAKPEGWILEEDCTGVHDQLPYPSREQRDPFLTDTDMTYGMSGSPLFDRDGLMIGIGTTILDSDPGDYKPGKHAVYIKAVHAARLMPK
ncbi:MAG: trypsin-like peptidase domain-containing protein [Elusimicrobia bacterium]|nr:trypsin-like peptidase domain-containing protein [Elusimicrobiota bacterium]